MSILPVLDVLGGEVVRGIGGRRAEYRRIASRWTASAEPVDVARALAARFGFSEFYLADLDAIAGRPPYFALYDAMHQQGFKLWVDAGIRNGEEARQLRVRTVATLVAGLETLAGPHVLQALCAEHGSDRIVFSLDLKAGRVLGNTEAWPSPGRSAIARHAIELGTRRLLILDLARVGLGMGTGTEELCRQLAAAHPEAQIAAGGGVASMADVTMLEASGVSTVLVASALHDGRITTSPAVP